MPEEYTEYRRRRREAQKYSSAGGHSILKKLARQTAFSLIILSATFGLRALDPTASGKLSTLFRSAMTQPVAAAPLQNILKQIIKPIQNTENPKEGQTNEATQPNAEKTE